MPIARDSPTTGEGAEVSAAQTGRIGYAGSGFTPSVIYELGYGYEPRV